MEASERTPGDSRARGDRAHRTGLFVNGGLAIGKLAVGSLTGSQALFADGLHSVSDFLTNGAAWLGYRFGALPPDEDHHYGHGNFEVLAGLLVGLVLLGGGLGIVWSGIGFGHGVEGRAQGVAAIAMAFVSIGTNLYLTHLTWRSGVELNSPSLLALARDNGSDVLTSVLVVAGVGGSLAGLDWAEPGVTVVIGLVVAFLGAKTVREGIGVLMGEVPDPDVRAELARVAGEVPNVNGVQRTRIQPVGSSLHVDMEISVDGALSVAEGHRIAHAVERAVRASHPHVVEVQVHVNPDEGSARS
jgi:cation diffusion facilitator family transporter